MFLKSLIIKKSRINMINLEVGITIAQGRRKVIILPGKLNIPERSKGSKVLENTAMVQGISWATE